MDTNPNMKVIPSNVHLVLALARRWLSQNPDADRRERRAYREAMNSLLCAFQMFDVAEIVRKELGNLFFPDSAERNDNNERSVG